MGFGTSYIPDRPAKGQPYRLYFHTTNIDGRSTNSFPSVNIRKDGGGNQGPSNSVVVLGNGAKYIELTADEMNADVIQVSMEYSSITDGIEDSYVIRTSPSEGQTGSGMALTDTVSDIMDAPEENPTVRDILSFLYQYFRKRRKRTKWSLNRHIFRG